MRMNLIRRTTERSFLARRESYPTQGKVISVDTTLSVATIDCGFKLPNGDPQYLYDVPFQPQSPPAVGWTATLHYATSDPQSVYIAMTRLSGQTPKSSVVCVGGTAYATATGQILISTDGSTFTAQLPIAADDGGILTNDQGQILIEGSGL